MVISESTFFIRLKIGQNHNFFDFGFLFFYYNFLRKSPRENKNSKDRFNFIPTTIPIWCTSTNCIVGSAYQPEHKLEKKKRKKNGIYRTDRKRVLRPQSIYSFLGKDVCVRDTLMNETILASIHRTKPYVQNLAVFGQFSSLLFMAEGDSVWIRKCVVLFWNSYI